MAVGADEDVLRLQVAVDESQSVEVLESDKHLCGEEPNHRDGEAVAGVAQEEGVEVPAGAVVDEEAGVVGGVHPSVESGEERVVESCEDSSLGSDMGEPSVVLLMIVGCR